MNIQGEVVDLVPITPDLVAEVREGLVFCDTSGKWDLCFGAGHDGCRRARILVGDFKPAPGRTRVPYTGQVEKGYSVCSSGDGGVRCCPLSGGIESSVRELGFVLAVNSETKEADIFTMGEHGYLD